MTPRGDQRLPFVVFGAPVGLLAGVALTVLISACAPQSDQERPDGIEVTDDLGNLVVLPEVPRRIVSLAPSTTEILFALRLDSSVVGVTDVCDYPPAAASVPKMGSMNSISFERIVDVRPDLVVMTVAGNTRADYDKLTSLGLPVFVTNPTSIEGVYKSLADLGRMTGRTGTADSLVETLRSGQRTVQTFAAGREKKSVLLLLSLRPLIAAGPDTFLDELIRLANGANAARNSPTSYPMLSREEVLDLQPDVLAVTTDIARTMDDVRNAYPEWRTLRAVQHGRIVILDASILSRPGPRIILGLQALAQAIHR